MDLDALFARPKLGVSTWPFGTLPLADIISRVQALGFDGVALSGIATAQEASDAAKLLQLAQLQPFALSVAPTDLAQANEAILDSAEILGRPLLLIRASLGRDAAFTLPELTSAIGRFAQRADARGLRLALEVVNRYETTVLNSAEAARAFVDRLNADNVGLALNAFHMNIEEQDAPQAITTCGDRLWLFKMADSNRLGLGRGHLKLGTHLWALEKIAYSGPIILECTVAGSDPFTPELDAPALLALEAALRDSRSWF